MGQSISCSCSQKPKFEENFDLFLELNSPNNRSKDSTLAADIIKNPELLVTLIKIQSILRGLVKRKKFRSGNKKVKNYLNRIESGETQDNIENIELISENQVNELLSKLAPLDDGIEVKLDRKVESDKIVFFWRNRNSK